MPHTPPAATRHALVTGGSRGIGRAIVERLAASGIRVTFSYATNHTAAAEVEKAVAAAGGHAVARQADATDIDALRTLMDGAAPAPGELDVVVVNAAVSPAGSPIAATPIEVYDQTMALNARSTFAALSHAAVAVRRGGAVITISSIVTRTAPPGMGPYVASKAAVEAMTTVAARELGAQDITVNSVSPGAVDTDALRAYQSPAALDQITRSTPLGRLGDGRDIAGMVAFLAGPDGRWITGQNLRVDGGRT